MKYFDFSYHYKIFGKFCDIVAYIAYFTIVSFPLYLMVSIPATLNKWLYVLPLVAGLLVTVVKIRKFKGVFVDDKCIKIEAINTFNRKIPLKKIESISIIKNRHWYDRLLSYTSYGYGNVECVIKKKNGKFCFVCVEKYEQFIKLVKERCPDIEIPVEIAPLGREVAVVIDRPLGSAHPVHKDLVYPVNYGYIQNITAGDGEEQDVYVLGVEEPLLMYNGKIIAIIHRNNDNEDKWVVSNKSYSKEEIYKLVRFQEQYFDVEIEII